MPPSDTISPTIARLASLVRESGLTQSEVAERAGMSAPALSRLLSGKIDPGVSQVERVVTAIGYRFSFTME